MFDTIFLNRKESAQFLAIEVDVFDREVLPHVNAIKWDDKILFKLEEIKLFANPSFIKSRPTSKPGASTLDVEGKRNKLCDRETSNLKETYKRLPRGAQVRLDDLLLRLQNISDKARGRVKG